MYRILATTADHWGWHAAAVPHLPRSDWLQHQTRYLTAVIRYFQLCERAIALGISCEGLDPGEKLESIFAKGKHLKALVVAAEARIPTQEDLTVTDDREA